MTRTVLDISGMTCAACAASVEKALSRVDGVSQADVNLALERANVEFDGTGGPEALIRAVEKAGYGASLRASGAAGQSEADEAREAARAAEERQTLLRFGFSVVLSAILVAGTLPMMVGAGEAWLNPWIQAALAAGVMALSGARFYREAFAAVRGGGANMAVLVSLGTTVAFIYSLVLVVIGQGHGHLYFEAAAVVLTLVMLGKYLEARAKRGASSALAALGRLQPRTAERVTENGTKTITVEELKRGDIILVRPGGRVPADGVVVSGETSIDESLVTGESLPIDKREGQKVITGTTNGQGAIEVRIDAVGEDTTLARMTKLIEDAQRGDAPIQRLVDRISAVFVPLILLAALLTFLGWWLIAGSAGMGLVAAVAVLVIACPCALGLATPTALVAGTGAAAKAGILIRDIETLERAETIGIVAFDKTGTLTVGHPQVGETIALDGDNDRLLRYAAALEGRSEHPLAKALAERAPNEDRLDVSGVTALGGKGLVGTVDGHRIAVGNAALAASEGIGAAETESLAAKLRTAGTISFVIIDGKLAGAILFSDEPRPEAAGTIAELKARGLQSIMLTGDNAAAAGAVAAKLGLSDVRASLLPEDKVAAIRDLARETGKNVAFVGDGLNDGAALAAARLGIALSSGTDVARGAAAITLMRPDLRLVPASLDIADRTRRTIRNNLIWAFIYNIIGIPLAAFGILSPVIAGAAMAFSSVSVVTNSLLLARWRPDLDHGA
ncbi:MAG TPA: cation-translocating P-type ATPase [Rhizobiaceae bacterium]|nr:cation-translocating P-type ATPase [Rhizobiaceae bacterium]